MSEQAEQPPLTDVGPAIDQIVAARGLKPAARRHLVSVIDDLSREFPKLPCVSFYNAMIGGSINCRATFRVPGYPRRTERLGRVPRLAYKRAQRISEVLQQVEARLMDVKEAHRLLYVDNTPISTHAERFIASLASKGNHPDYVASQSVRLTRCFELGAYRRMTDITRESLPALIDALSSYVEPGKKRPLTKSTINQYLKVLRQFTKWATPVLIPSDPLYNTVGVKNTEQRKRRDVLPEEVAAVVLTARSGRVKRMRMSGADRAMLYLLAFGTGFRRNEIRQLLVPMLKLDATPPHIQLPAALAKNRKQANQPMPAWLSEQLKLWLGGRRSGRLFRYMPGDIASVFDRDRAAARAAWIEEAKDDAAARTAREKSEFLARETADGTMVFHSHRHGYTSQLLGSGMDLKSAQLLTRHATVSMLADRYAHSRLAKAAAGVDDAIRDPTRTQTKAATESTDGRSA